MALWSSLACKEIYFGNTGTTLVSNNLYKQTHCALLPIFLCHNHMYILAALKTLLPVLLQKFMEIFVIALTATHGLYILVIHAGSMGL